MEPARAGATHLMRVEAGKKIFELNEDLHRQHLALSTMGNYAGQAIYGAICTGSHGSRFTAGPMADDVVSLELVTLTEYEGNVRARRLRIEPRAGVTDPATFPASAEQELIQDDQVFYASVVSFGALGMVYAITLKVRDQFRLLQTHELVDWTREPKGLLERLQGEDGFAEIHVLPYPEAASGTTPALITRRQERRTKPATAVADPDSLLDAIRTIPVWAATTARPHLAPLMDLVRHSFDRLDQSLGECLAAHPDTLRCLYRELFARRAKTRFYGRSSEILPLGMGDIIEVQSLEVGIALSETNQAIEELTTRIAEWEREGLYLTAPIGLRFIAPSPHYLSMSYDRPSCMIEVPIFSGTPHAGRMLKEVEVILDKWGGRPHWGFANNLSAERAQALYPRYTEAREVYFRFNRFGVFTNLLTERVFGPVPVGV
jgi:FAD/FMN-containing dehydrogenase